MQFLSALLVVSGPLSKRLIEVVSGESLFGTERLIGLRRTLPSPSIKTKHNSNSLVADFLASGFFSSSFLGFSFFGSVFSIFLSSAGFTSDAELVSSGIVIK